MTDLAFPGYRAFPAAPDDPLRLKWRTVRAIFDKTPRLTIRLDLNSVARQNLAINAFIAYTPEPRGADDWQDPARTWSTRKGDCEDFAILKYAVLLNSGLPEQNLRLVVGEIKSAMKQNPAHAWCAAYLDGAWRCLDNKFDQLIAPDEYLKTNFIPVAAMGGGEVVKFVKSGKQFTINDAMKES